MVHPSLPPSGSSGRAEGDCEADEADGARPSRLAATAVDDDDGVDDDEADNGADSPPPPHLLRRAKRGGP